MKNSKWFKTIEYFLKKGYVNNGLTLPFLIGLYPVNKVSIRDLIIDMSKINQISIQMCDVIDDFVFGIYYYESTEDIKLFKNLNGLIITDDSLDRFTSLDELIAFFESEYNDKIQKKLYSKNNGIWTYYNEKEIKGIDDLNQS